MKFYEWSIKMSVIILISFIFYYTANFVINHQISTIILPYCLVLLACCKVSYLLYSTYKKIIESANQNLAFHKFLFFVLMNMSLAICSFAADFWNIYALNHSYFEGINPEFTTFEQIFECLYFSMLTYSYFGYGEILPTTIPSKLLVMMEVGLAFLTMIFVLADFIGLKESLKENQ
jgi:hypothetical protein